MSEAMLTQVGAYDVVRKLGAGGMGTAWLASAPDGRLVVLKVPRGDDADVLARLQTEASVGARLRHSALIRTRELIEHRGRPVLVVDYIDGEPLSDLLRHGPFDVGGVAEMGHAIAGALAAIHTAVGDDGAPLRALHRDVTLANVLLDTRGCAMLIDLGIARADDTEHRTQTGTLLGTLPYLAPELFEQDAYSTASDLWALGCLLFAAATGERLYGGSNAALVHRLLHEEAWDHPAWPSLDPALDDLLRAVLQRDVTSRLADAATFSARLGWLADKHVDARSQLRARVARHRAEGPPPQTRGTGAHTMPLVVQPRPTERFHDDDVPRPRAPTPYHATLGWSSSTKSGAAADLCASLDDDRSPAPEVLDLETLLAGPAPAFEALKPGEELSAPAPEERLGRENLRVFALDQRPDWGLPPVVDAPSGLALDRSGRLGPREDAPAITPRSAERIALRRSELTGARARLVVAALALAALLGAALRTRHVEHQTEQAPPPRHAARDVPACYRGDQGFAFIYLDASGSNAVVQTIAEVPKHQRRAARCVPLD